MTGATYSTPNLYSELDTAYCENALSVRSAIKELIFSCIAIRTITHLGGKYQNKGRQSREIEIR